MTAETTTSGAQDAPETPPGLGMASGSAREPVAPPTRSGDAPGAPQDGGSSATAPATPPVKRGPGRPKGLGKVPGSGRAPGTPNKSTVQTRSRIEELADPIGFLADVMAGKRMTAAGEPGDMKRTWCYPSLAQRVAAGETLLRKLLPDLKSQELTGKDGSPLVPEPTHHEKLIGIAETARVIGFAIARGEVAKRELDDLDAPEPDPVPQRVPEPEPEPEPPAEPTEPALPKHAYIYIEEGERERSGSRAWLAMEGRGQILRTFHGPDARALARHWIGTKYAASPAEEFEVPLEEELT